MGEAKRRKQTDPNYGKLILEFGDFSVDGGILLFTAAIGDDEIGGYASPVITPDNEISMEWVCMESNCNQNRSKQILKYCATQANSKQAVEVVKAELQ